MMEYPVDRKHHLFDQWIFRCYLYPAKMNIHFVQLIFFYITLAKFS